MGRTKPNQSPNSGHTPANYGVEMEQTPATYPPKTEQPPAIYPPKTEQTPATYPPANYGIETEQHHATYPPKTEQPPPIYPPKTEETPATYPPADYGVETEQHPASYPPAEYEMEQSPEVYHPASPHSSYEDYEQPQRPPPAQVYENQNYAQQQQQQNQQQQQQQQQPVQWPPAPARAYPPEAGYDGRKNDQGVAFGQPEQAVQWPPAQAVAMQNNLNVAGRSPAVFTGSQQGMQEMSPYPFIAGNQWSTQLFDCEMNSDLAVLTAFAPCVTFGQIAEIIDEGQTSCALGSLMYGVLLPILSYAMVGTLYRQRLRERYNLIQHPAEDWILHLFCPCCALCQEYRELQIRGIDPSLGWLGYLAQQQQKQGLPTTSPMMQTMQR